MNIKNRLQEANAATKKLNDYSDGVKAAGGKDATAKYKELNSKADKAIRSLPKALRSRVVVENLGKKK